MKDSKVDEFFRKVQRWQKEVEFLRRLVLECDLSETFKWRQPCYTWQDKNVLIISPFKNYCALNFFKGTLLKDTDKVLIQAGENSQAARQWRFTNIEDIHKHQTLIKAYIFEAIEIEKAGLKAIVKKRTPHQIPEELRQRFEEQPGLRAAFESLTPGRQRGYLIHFMGAKQTKTRFSRIDKYISRILKGQGIHDCVCGLSKRMPNCDGSHKILKK